MLNYYCKGSDILKSETERLEEIIKILNSKNIIKDYSPKNVKETIELLGPTFIKLGQIMSTRDDLIPSNYTKELKSLCSDVLPMDFSIVEKILKQQYKNKEIFSYVSKKSIGSASIAQVHKATLKTGQKVVIKVQRLQIDEMMSLDIKLLKKANSILHIDKLLGNIIDLDKVIEEIYNVAKEEMDFTKEESNILEFDNNNKDIEYIYVPKTYPEYTTKKVLIMEYIEGMFINNTKELEEEGYNLKDLAKMLATNYIKQAIDDGFFHADPHADNIKVLNNQIIFIDFGMMGRISIQNKNLLNRCIKAILDEDIHEIEEVLLIMNTNDEEIDKVLLYADIKKVLAKNKTTGIKEISIVSFIKDLLKVFNDNAITLPKDITMLVRGIVVIEGVLKEIDPTINLESALKTHIKVDDYISKEKIQNYILKLTKSGIDLTLLPKEVLTLLKGINNGEMRFNLELNDSKHQLDKIEKLVHELIITILDVAFIIAIAIILMNRKSSLPFMFYIFLTLFSLCSIWLIFTLYHDKK